MQPALKVGIAGFGTIGWEIGERLDRGEQGLELAAVSARDIKKAEAAMAGFRRPVPVVPLSDLPSFADVIIECAPAAVFRELALPVLKAGRILMPLSVGALLAHDDLVQLAEDNGARIGPCPARC